MDKVLIVLWVTALLGVPHGKCEGPPDPKVAAASAVNPVPPLTPEYERPPLNDPQWKDVPAPPGSPPGPFLQISPGTPNDAYQAPPPNQLPPLPNQKPVAYNAPPIQLPFFPPFKPGPFPLIVPLNPSFFNADLDSQPRFPIIPTGFSGPGWRPGPPPPPPIRYFSHSYRIPNWGWGWNPGWSSP